MCLGLVDDQEVLPVVPSLEKPAEVIVAQLVSLLFGKFGPLPMFVPVDW